MFHGNLEDRRKGKALEKHLEIVSQINLKMESLQAKIKELENGGTWIKVFQVSFQQSKLMTSGFTLWLNVKN